MFLEWAEESRMVGSKDWWMWNQRWESSERKCFLPWINERKLEHQWEGYLEDLIKSHVFMKFRNTELRVLWWFMSFPGTWCVAKIGYRALWSGEWIKKDSNWLRYSGTNIKSGKDLWHWEVEISLHSCHLQIFQLRAKNLIFEIGRQEKSRNQQLHLLSVSVPLFALPLIYLIIFASVIH